MADSPASAIASDVPQVPAPDDVARPPADALASGAPGVPNIATKVLRPGSGTVRPGATDRVTVTYTAWTTDGVTIDSSASRNRPSVWAVDTLMPGLRQGLTLMTVGERRRLWIPRELAYPWSTGMLVFDVELVATSRERVPPAADDFVKPPAAARHTSSGLAWTTVHPGHGTEHPRPFATVTMNYTGWTSDRRTFDDSVARQAPATVAVDELIPGLSEALQLMVVGETSRFWIPAALAFTPPGPPQSALVVDVELLAIQRAAEGANGSVEIRTNSPDAGWVLVQPDGTPRPGKGPQTLTGMPPGRYRIKPDKMKSYAVGILASAADITLAPAGTLVITVTYRPMIQ